jgi:hypothetical protein
VPKTREESHALRNDGLQVGAVEEVVKVQHQFHHGVGREIIEVAATAQLCDARESIGDK